MKSAYVIMCGLSVVLGLERVPTASSQGTLGGQMLNFRFTSDVTEPIDYYNRSDRYELLDIDTLLYIENRGLERLFIDLNGHTFKLVTDEDELHRSVNAFLIPQNGEITVHIGRYINPGEDNYMEVASQGSDGATANLIIADLMLPGQVIAYSIENLERLPEGLALRESYPNPFRDRTRIAFEISEERIAGVAVRLVIYDALGREVRTLMEDVRYPGVFTVDWDGTDASGSPVASGIYFCQLQTEGFQRTIRILRIK